MPAAREIFAGSPRAIPLPTIPKSSSGIRKAFSPLDRPLRLAFRGRFPNRPGMGLPAHAVTFTPEQIVELNNKLSKMRHDINNNLAMLLAAAELVKRKPATAEKMLARILEQPQK